MTVLRSLAASPQNSVGAQPADTSCSPSSTQPSPIPSSVSTAHSKEGNPR